MLLDTRPSEIKVRQMRFRRLVRWIKRNLIFSFFAIIFFVNISLPIFAVINDESYIIKNNDEFKVELVVPHEVKFNRYFNVELKGDLPIGNYIIFIKLNDTDVLSKGANHSDIINGMRFNLISDTIGLNKINIKILSKATMRGYLLSKDFFVTTYE